MNFGEWQVKIYENPGTISIDLWLFRSTSMGREVLTHDGTIKQLKEGSATDFNDYFARFESMEQVQVIAEAFAKFGVKTANDHKLEGLLEAKDAHLQDMRRLVFEATPQTKQGDTDNDTE